MANKVIKCVCKDCGKTFEYDRLPLALKAEKGESRPERCADCRRIHRAETGSTRIGYFGSLKKDILTSECPRSGSGYASHGEREFRLENAEAEVNMDFAIKDKDILAFYEKLERNQVVIVVAPTGSGKSTFLPSRLLNPPLEYKGDLIERLIRQGQIIITEPLTEAVERIPEFIAKELLGSKVGPGRLVGLRHASQTSAREGEKWDRWNLMVPVTDGSLRNWIREGKLGSYSLIMVDEAHQRSCNIETILMLLKNELPRYPNLKLVVVSATINAEGFKTVLEEAAVKTDILTINVDAKKRYRQFVHFWGQDQKVEDCDCWLCQNPFKRKRFWQREAPPKESELDEVIAEMTLQILKETQEGSILIFLHGKEIIDDTVKRIKEAKRKIDPKDEIPVIGVYRLLGEEEVKKRFDLKAKTRRVLVATNIAETSHTIDDVVYAIDSGFIKESEWNPDAQVSKLQTRRHSQDGCRQRWGRIGRVRDGYVYCLYTKEEFEKFETHTLPEITRSCLEEVILTLYAAGITDPKYIPWLEK